MFPHLGQHFPSARRILSHHMLTLCVNDVDNALEQACTGGLLPDEGVEMLVILGVIVLLVAAIVTIVGVLSNAGAAHPLTDNFAVFG
jgi:hypothetical protein